MSYKVLVKDSYEDQNTRAEYMVDGYVEDCVFIGNHLYLDNDRGDGRADIVRFTGNNDLSNVSLEKVEDGVWITEESNA